MMIAAPGKNDFQAMAEIYNRATQQFWAIYSEEEKILFADMRSVTADELQEESSERPVLCLKETDGAVSAYASFRQKNDQVVWISSLYVHPGHQQQGKGSALLQAIEDFARQNDAKLVALETHLNADWAISFYLKNDYTLVNNFTDQYPYHFILDKPPAPNRPLLAKIISDNDD